MSQQLPSPAEIESRRPQMFPVLTPAQLARIRAFGTETTCEAGALVWEQGDDHVPLLVVLDGELEIVHPEGALETRITIHRANEFSGDTNLLTGRRSLVRGRAKTRLR